MISPLPLCQTLDRSVGMTGCYFWQWARYQTQWFAKYLATPPGYKAGRAILLIFALEDNISLEHPSLVWWIKSTNEKLISGLLSKNYILQSSITSPDKVLYPGCKLLLKSLWSSILQLYLNFHYLIYCIIFMGLICNSICMSLVYNIRNHSLIGR